MILRQLFNLTSGVEIRDSILSFIAYIIVVLFSLSLHEFGHAFAAYRCGDDTAKVAGRLTLNPIAHIDPIGFIMFLIVGFGYAKPVPVNSRNFKNYKPNTIAISSAGILTNILLALFSLLLLYIYSTIPFSINTSQTAIYIRLFIYYIFSYGVFVNFMLAFFNLLPIYPLDGFRILDVLLPYDNAYSRFMYRYGNYILLGLLILSSLSGFIGQYLPFFAYLNIFDLFNRLISHLIGFFV
ncbi:MAG: site-2 protease family protein [Christensenellaceae bacterium]|jgi:Zn-dependent protease|nr:site-2 protease family protein [Christensenellaceae bacterium]